MRFEVFSVVKMSMLVLWVITPCGLVGRYSRFGETSSGLLNCFYVLSSVSKRILRDLFFSVVGY
jgi:hypothetical protein